MPDFVYSLKRVLFGQPLSVTRAVLRSHFLSLVGGKRSGETEAQTTTHPIDLVYGIETSGMINPSKMRSGSNSDIFNIGYGGVQPSPLREVLKKIPDIETACFLDIGCGKGRALAVATEFPFRRIVGVELSPALTRIAEGNAAIMATRFPDRPPIEVVEGDALKYELPPGFLVAYLYNPGFGPLVRGLAARIADHQAIPGNRVLVVYCTPILGSVFDGHRAFERFYAGSFPLGPEDSDNYGETENSFVIWKARSDRLSRPLPGANARIRTAAAHAVVEP
jgi:SAM-dependent methyltransferase